MAEAPSIEAYTQEVWRAVAELWPKLGKDPAGVVEPQIPALPAFLAEAHREGRTPESAAVEVTRFFLDIYVRNALNEDERKARLVDLHALSKRTYEEAQAVSVLPFTAALVTAQQTLSGWAAAGKVEKGAGQSLNRDVLSALLGKPGGELSRLGWLTLQGARKR
jgi:hypothetical protein